jgi:hypothetical protein
VKRAAFFLLVVVCSPATAHAADVRVARDQARFTAARGEENRVRVARRGPQLLIDDAGAPIDAGAGCRALAAHRVHCRARRFRGRLGNGSDRFRGGAERDHVTGGPGADVLDGGDGLDYLRDDSRDADVLRGGAGADLLAGARGPDALRGGFAPDTIVAEGVGSTVSGGPGPDRIAALPRVGRIDCGPGRDSIAPLGLRRAIPRSCEHFQYQQLEEDVSARARRLSARRLEVPVPDLCGTLEVRGSCRVRVVLRQHGRSVGTAITAVTATRVRVRGLPRGARSIGIRTRAPPRTRCSPSACRSSGKSAIPAHGWQTTNRSA